MTRAWKPGDVALIKFSSGDHRAIRDVDGSWLVVGKASSPGYAVDRPLVVIDPEDRALSDPLPDVDSATDAKFEAWAMRALWIANTAAFEADARAEIEALTRGEIR